MQNGVLLVIACGPGSPRHRRTRLVDVVSGTKATVSYHTGDLNTFCYALQTRHVKVIGGPFFIRKGTFVGGFSAPLMTTHVYLTLVI